MKTLYSLFFVLALALPNASFAECGGAADGHCGSEKCTCAADCQGCEEGTCTCEECECDTCTKDKE